MPTVPSQPPQVPTIPPSVPDVNLAPLPESVRNTLRDHDKKFAEMAKELERLRKADLTIAGDMESLKSDIAGAKNDIANLAKRQGEALRLLVEFEETIAKHDKALSEPIVIDVIQNGERSRAQRLLGSMTGVNGEPFIIEIETEGK